MRSLISYLVVAVIMAIALSGCATGSGTAAPTLTPEQQWSIGKNAAKGVGVGVVLSQSKNGKFLGFSSADVIAEIGPVVDTLAADFQPGAVANADARAKTRQAGAEQLARVLFKADFKAADDDAKARQATDVAAMRAIVDPIADSLLTTFGKQ